MDVIRFERAVVKSFKFELLDQNRGSLLGSRHKFFSNFIIITELFDNIKINRKILEKLIYESMLFKCEVYLTIYSYFVNKKQFAEKAFFYKDLFLQSFNDQIFVEEDNYKFYLSDMSDLLIDLIRKEFFDYNLNFKVKLLKILEIINSTNSWINYLISLRPFFTDLEIEKFFRKIELNYNLSDGSTFTKKKYIKLLAILEKTEKRKDFILKNRASSLDFRLKDDNFLEEYLSSDPNKEELESVLKNSFYFSTLHLSKFESSIEREIPLFSAAPLNIGGETWERVKKALIDQIYATFLDYLQQGPKIPTKINDRIKIDPFVLGQVKGNIESLITLIRLLNVAGYKNEAEMVANDTLFSIQNLIKDSFPDLIGNIDFSNFKPISDKNEVLYNLYSKNNKESQLLLILKSFYLLKKTFIEFRKSEIANLISKNIDTLIFSKDLYKKIQDSSLFLFLQLFDKIKNLSEDNFDFILKINILLDEKLFPIFIKNIHSYILAFEFFKKYYDNEFEDSL